MVVCLKPRLQKHHLCALNESSEERVEEGELSQGGGTMIYADVDHTKEEISIIKRPPFTKLFLKTASR